MAYDSRQRDVEIDVPRQRDTRQDTRQDARLSAPPPTDVQPEIGFFFDPSIGVQLGYRKSLKKAIKEKIEAIDPVHVARDRWKYDLEREDVDEDGHIDEQVIEDTLDAEVSQLNGAFSMGAQVKWCYVVHGEAIICYHCYVLIENNAAVTVTKRGSVVPLSLYYAWELPWPQ